MKRQKSKDEEALDPIALCHLLLAEHEARDSVEKLRLIRLTASIASASMQKK